jgi:hypothetical protein
MARRRPAAMLVLALAAVLLAAARPSEALSVTVTDTECVHEFVPYEGDTVSGNFVVVDHDIFWSSDHPGIDLTVRARSPRARLLRGWFGPRDRDSGWGLWVALVTLWRGRLGIDSGPPHAICTLCLSSPPG